MPREKMPNSIPTVDRRTTALLNDLAKTWGEQAECFPFLLTDDHITPQTVDNVFDELQAKFGVATPSGNLIVVVDSGGGDIDAAYNLALLFRQYGSQRLTYVVPRWAKSAATLLVCGGDSVMMTPVAELGPLDPQITQMNPMEQRLESFSPLHIESTLELIRNEFNNGNKELADGLMQRLQFPITLGSFKKSLEVGKQYAYRLLSSRMHKGDEVLATKIANNLVEDYADHGFCINFDEASALGLAVERPTNAQLNLIWDIHKLAKRRAELRRSQREQEIQDKLKQLPPSILESLPPGMINNGPNLPLKAGGKNA